MEADRSTSPGQRNSVRLAIAGVGNNTSALMQGLTYYRSLCPGEELPGVARAWLCGIHIVDIEIVAAFDVAETKVGKPLNDAVLAAPNNFPTLPTGLDPTDVVVEPGIGAPEDVSAADRVSDALRRSGAEVLLYSLPTGLGSVATAYAMAAVRAEVAVVNCTPDPVARDPEIMEHAQRTGVAVVGDDLQSHLGSSVVHGSLLQLWEERGITLTGSYQVNLGGNADFQNLRMNSAAKEKSKYNALRQRVSEIGPVTVIPSGGVIPHLHDRKVAHISIEGRGWGNMPVRVDLQLQVQDSSNAAGVIGDLVRIAADARRRRGGGFPLAAAPLLKSPPLGPDMKDRAEAAREALERLTRRR